MAINLPINFQFLIVFFFVCATFILPVRSGGKYAFTIESDRQTADNHTGIVTATGNVRVVYSEGDVMATSHKLHYYSDDNRVVFTGDVTIFQGDGNQLKAEQVTYFLDEDKVVALPNDGEQVTSSWFIDTLKSYETGNP